MAELAEEEEEELVEDDTQTPKVLQAKRLPRTGATPEGNSLAFRPRSDQPLRAQNPETGNSGVYQNEPVKSSSRIVAALTAACFLLLGLVAYLWLQKSQSTPLAATLRPEQATVIAHPTTPQSVTDRALELADSALIALQNGDLAKAADLYRQARQQKLNLPGLNYQSALLATVTGEDSVALPLIDHGIAANEDAPGCFYLRARLAGREGNYADAAECFRQAARLTPFTARNYFFWAECLRRKGSLSSAQSQFDHALLCRPAAAESDLIRFKMRLAKVEAGGDEKFREELTSYVTAPNPTGDTLLLAAADSMNRHDYPAAAEYLRRCARSVPPPFLQSRLGDYFFGNYLALPEIASALVNSRLAPPVASLDPAGKPPLFDPANRGLAETDPANW